MDMNINIDSPNYYRILLHKEKQSIRTIIPQCFDLSIYSKDKIYDMINQLKNKPIKKAGRIIGKILNYNKNSINIINNYLYVNFNGVLYTDIRIATPIPDFNFNTSTFDIISTSIDIKDINCNK